MGNRPAHADGIYSTMPTYRVTANSLLGMDYEYEYWQGTSMSAALVSGLSALLLSAIPGSHPGASRTPWRAPPST